MLQWRKPYWLEFLIRTRPMAAATGDSRDSERGGAPVGDVLGIQRENQLLILADLEMRPARWEIVGVEIAL